MRGEIWNIPIFPSLRTIRFPRGDIPEGSNAVRMKKDLDFGCSWDRVERRIPKNGVLLDLNFFQFPGIQVRVGVKNTKAFMQIMKIGEPLATLWRVSRHINRVLEKYFFQRACLLQESLLEIRFQRSLAPRTRLWSRRS